VFDVEEGIKGGVEVNWVDREEELYEITDDEEEEEGQGKGDEEED